MIKNSYELANILGRAFERYANTVQNGNTQPYEGLLTQSEVEVVFTVDNGGGIRIRPYVETVKEVIPESEAPVAPIVEQPILEPTETAPTKKKRVRKKTE